MKTIEHKGVDYYVTSHINGYNEEAMLGVLYARTGFSDFEQVKGE